MSGDDDAETTGELEVDIVGIVGPDLTRLQVALTIAPQGGEPDEIASQVVDVAELDPLRSRPRASFREWIVGVATDAAGLLHAVTADGALRLGTEGRRYPLPARRGLSALWIADVGDLLVCGPGVLGRIRLGAGRIAIDLTEDDGPGDAWSVVGPGRVEGAIATGSHGALWSYDGRDWIAHETAARETLIAAAWHDDRHAIVVGAEGGVFLWDGVALRETTRSDRAWTSVATWRGHAYLAGGRDGLWRLDGDALVPVKALPVRHVAVVADQLFAWAGSLVTRFDGAAWWGGPLHLSG